MRSAEGRGILVWSVVFGVLVSGCRDVPDGIPDNSFAGSERAVRGGRQAVAKVTFTEQTTIPLPEDRQLNGAALSPSGNLVVAWFARTPGVRVFGGPVPKHILAADIGQATGVEFLNDELLEILDVASGDVVTADIGGVVHARRDLPDSRQATAAARTATGWILAIAGADSVPSHLRLPQEGGNWVPDPIYTGALGLGVSGERREALVWQALSPFGAWQIGRSPEEASVEFEPMSTDWFNDAVASAMRQAPALWSVTSVVAVGSGYVQTLANRGTDDRVLLWFDKRGRFLRYVHLQVPFGFVAAAARAPVMLAIRTLNNSELVKYSWEQIPGATMHQQEARP